MRLDCGGPRAARNECAASARVAAGRLAPSDATCLGEARRKQRGWPLAASHQQGPSFMPLGAVLPARAEWAYRPGLAAVCGKSCRRCGHVL
jgi:hypothetical protein